MICEIWGSAEIGEKRQTCCPRKLDLGSWVRDDRQQIILQSIFFCRHPQTTVFFAWYWQIYTSARSVYVIGDIIQPSITQSHLIFVPTAEQADCRGAYNHDGDQKTVSKQACKQGSKQAREQASSPRSEVDLKMHAWELHFLQDPVHMAPYTTYL